MYVRVISFVCRPDAELSTLTDIYRQMIQEATQADGFIGSNLLLNQENARAMAQMYWQDQHAASSASPTVLQHLSERLHEIVSEAPEVIGYDVIEVHGFTNEAL